MPRSESSGVFVLIPISLKNDKLGETTLREKTKIHSGIHDTLSGIVIFI